MPKFRIVRELAVSTAEEYYIVEADTVEEAIAKHEAEHEKMEANPEQQVILSVEDSFFDRAFKIS